MSTLIGKLSDTAVTKYSVKPYRPETAACGISPNSHATSFPGYLGNTLVWAGHVPRPKFSARGGVGKVSNYMIPVEIFCLTVNLKT
jgi:hypothetical protein